jgi:hypothetical protein
MTSNVEWFPWFRNFVINPVTDWHKFINPQFAVTINEGDAAIENHVLSRAGSYGMQLGRMQEVLDILVAHLPGERNADERSALAQYGEMRRTVVDAVQEASLARTALDGAPDPDDLVRELRRLKDRDASAYDRYAAKLLAFLRSAES